MNFHFMFAAFVTCFVVFCCIALQSPIEYQRRESKSNSLGRTMRPPMCAASGLRPHSSASMDRQRAPCLRAYNTSLPSLYLSSQGPGDMSAQLEVQTSLKYTLHIVRLLTHTRPGVCDLSFHIYK